MTSHLIFETEHWLVGHRRDSRHPGYLMVSSREQQSDLCHLTSEALMELGSVLKRTEELLRAAYNPLKVLFYKLGFSPGFSCHFHVAPVTQALLDEVIRHPQYDNDPDGNDVILFLSRVYCERELTRVEADIQSLAVANLVSLHNVRHTDRR
jgi:diadenosine tetraphosphate (Ap4A) HIT family hydrolase